MSPAWVRAATVSLPMEVVSVAGPDRPDAETSPALAMISTANEPGTLTVYVTLQLLIPTQSAQDDSSRTPSDVDSCTSRGRCSPYCTFTCTCTRPSVPGTTEMSPVLRTTRCWRSVVSTVSCS